MISVRNITDDLNKKGFKSISKSDFDFDFNNLEILNDRAVHRPKPVQNFVGSSLG